MLISFGASARRVAAAAGLLSALSGVSAAADPSGETVGERKASAYHEILRDRILRGEVLLTETAGSLSGAGMTEEGPPQEAAPPPCFTEEPAPDPVEGRVADATLMLMATYVEDGTGETFAYYGTGTVIRADAGLNRVLTAAHVANPLTRTPDGVTASLTGVYGFDGEGRLIATLDPVLANGSRITSGSITQELLHEDVMVLAPSAFPDRETALSWQGRGVEVSPTQSETALLFHGEGGSSYVAPGYSGAALLDPTGRAVGLITEVVPVLNSYRPAPNTPMPEAVLDQMEGGSALLPLTARTLLEEAALGPSVGVTVDAVAGGPPLSSPRVLAALGVDPARIESRSTLDTERLYSAGFPGRECRGTWLTYVPRVDVPFLDRTDGHLWTPPPDPVVRGEPAGELLVLGSDGQLRTRGRGAGFTMEEFISTIDALGARSRSRVEVTDPFSPSGPEAGMGEPP